MKFAAVKTVDRYGNVEYSVVASKTDSEQENELKEFIDDNLGDEESLEVYTLEIVGHKRVTRGLVWEDLSPVPAKTTKAKSSVDI